MTGPAVDPPGAPPRVFLLGVPVHRVTAPGAIDHIAGELARGRGGWVITPNLEILRRLVVDRDFRELCEPAELRLPDGMPLIWASRLQNTPLPERVAGSDLIWTLSAWAAANGRSVFLLGGNPGAAEQAARELVRRSPTLKIAGTICPPMGFENDASYMASLRQTLRTASPDIVYVGLGSPKQERLIRAIRAEFPRSWFLGIGVSFSFVAGEISRAPAWMRKVGLEWFHRVLQEPGRLFRRYFVDGLPFAARLFVGSALRRGRATVDAEPSPPQKPEGARVSGGE
jgi:N-acetylglucosaminyldiphosphoundecaprenol N-acetyl-beta-D-mannosaminyltransferase